MVLSSPLRKFTLTVHVVASVGWLGALAAFFAHAVAGSLTRDELMLQATAMAMGLIAWFVILPLSITSFVTGLVQAFGTAWGLLRHYWVIFKLALTVVATGVLLLKLGPIDALAEAATKAAFASADYSGLRISLLVHAAGGLVVLLAAVTLAILKPAGRTPFHGLATPMPRWVKVSVSVLAVLLVLLVLMMLGGEHGPGAHVPR